MGVGSLLGGKSPKAKQSNTVVVPEWLNKQNKAAVNRAVTLSNKPYEKYTGQRVADTSADTSSAYNLARQSTGKYNPLLDSASSGVLELLGRSKGPASYEITNLMNPYIQNVLDVQRRKATEVAGDQNAELVKRAGMTSSFGGSGLSLERQRQRRDLATQMNDIESQGLFDAFKSAMDQWNTGTNTLSQGVGQALQTASQGQQYNTNDIANLLKIGALQEEKAQQGLDVAYSDWDTEQAYPYEQVTWLSNILNPQTGAYAGTESTSSQTQGSGSKLGQALGIASSVASFFPSDERVKENIEQVGELDNGLKVYKYNYKGDPRTQIGLIAQEVEKDNPEAVTELGGTKMVNYDEATKEQGYASGGAVSSPQLLEALRQKVSSAGSPNFTSISAPKQDSSNPILEMLGKEGGIGSIIGDKAGDISELFKGNNQYDNPIGPTMKADSSGFMGLGGAQGGASFLNTIGNFFGFAEGGFVERDGRYVENLFDTEEEDARKRAAYEASKKLSDEVQQGGETYAEKVLKAVMSPSELATPKPGDTTIQSLGRDALNVQQKGLPLALLMELADNEGVRDFLVNPASEVDTERKASLSDRQELTNLLSEKAKEKGAPTDQGMDLPTLLTKGKNGMPMPSLNPNTGEPYLVGEAGEATDLPMNLVPPVQDTSVGEKPDAELLEILKNGMLPKRKPDEVNANSPASQKGGVNVPLLMAGLAMLASKGDTSTALAEGATAFFSTKSNTKKAQREQEALDEEKRQQEIKNMLDYLKLQAYMKQVNSKPGASSGGLTPYQEMLLKLKQRALDIQQQNADTKKQQSTEFQNIFGTGTEGLTTPTQNGNLEELLKAFEEQESSQ